MAVNMAGSVKAAWKSGRWQKLEHGLRRRHRLQRQPGSSRAASAPVARGASVALLSPHRTHAAARCRRLKFARPRTCVWLPGAGIRRAHHLLEIDGRLLRGHRANPCPRGAWRCPRSRLWRRCARAQCVLRTGAAFHRPGYQSSSASPTTRGQCPDRPAHLLAPHQAFKRKHRIGDGTRRLPAWLPRAWIRPARIDRRAIAAAPRARRRLGVGRVRGVRHSRALSPRIVFTNSDESARYDSRASGWILRVIAHCVRCTSASSTTGAANHSQRSWCFSGVVPYSAAASFAYARQPPRSCTVRFTSRQSRSANAASKCR